MIGATNRPDLLDPALLRPGRLDKAVWVGVDPSPTHKHQVLTALTRKFHLDPGVDLAQLAATVHPRLTGADLYALCADAWLGAVRREFRRVLEGEMEETDGPDTVVVRAEDFAVALTRSRPSVTDADMERYARIRAGLVAK